ncbi:MAG: hypothetical protein QOK42_127 [Frankiaceae bacterium]|nr:hypothetical protein [Frankiaceae bacterium]MDX6224257.1 hypothetical protein [Frankiales bacterium]MDX6275613.1 hypothetical protein [Frankiales bacterium]
MPTRSHAATVKRVERASGEMSSAALGRMEERLAWFRELPADQRSWIGLVAQAGVARFVEWARNPKEQSRISGDVFGAAPRELTRFVTLQQTVDLVQVAAEVFEEHVPQLATGDEQAWLLTSVLRYSRDIAFGAAQVYAAAAEERGAWDARLEALVIDALLRGDPDDGLMSRAAALGWAHRSQVAVLAGRPPQAEPEAVVEGVRRTARHLGIDALAGVQADRLVVVIADAADPRGVAERLSGVFAPGPVCVGPLVDGLAEAGLSAAAALAALNAAAGWPGAKGAVPADDLLPERALDGDPLAHDQLVHDVYLPLRDAAGELLETVAAYIDNSGSLEATARALFVHPNTVRYRLRKATDACGWAVTEARHALVLHAALALGRLAESRGEL